MATRTYFNFSNISFDCSRVVTSASNVLLCEPIVVRNRQAGDGRLVVPYPHSSVSRSQAQFLRNLAEIPLFEPSPSSISQDSASSHISRFPPRNRRDPANVSVPGAKAIGHKTLTRTRTCMTTVGVRISDPHPEGTSLTSLTTLTLLQPLINVTIVGACDSNSLASRSD
jgi:hypothetical protein